MTPHQIEILQHSLGVDQYGKGRQYRNFFDAGDDDDATCQQLVELGFMRKHPSTAIFPGHNYSVTDAGRSAMHAESPAPPKLTPGQVRYRRWLNCSDCFPDWTFGDFLKHEKELNELK